ncbi:MAG TPA: hypothetical protein VKV17_08235 [Bryobacteraceae bacterium]|nr:hypothetical protein [Bryobacteraceae bacterium]
MQATGNTLMASANSFFHFLPTLIGAILLLILGWIVAVVLGRLTQKGLRSAGFDRHMEGMNTGHRLTGTRWPGSRLLGELVKWFVFLLFVVGAANLLDMPQITSLLNSIVLFIPRVIVAVALVLIGVLLGRFLAGIVRRAMGEGRADSALVSRMVEYGVIALAVIAALDQIHVAAVVVNTLYIGLVAAACLALGLAFGLGGRGVATEITQSWYERSQHTISRPQQFGTEEQPGIRRVG